MNEEMNLVEECETEECVEESYYKPKDKAREDLGDFKLVYRKVYCSKGKDKKNAIHKERKPLTDG